MQITNFVTPKYPYFNFRKLNLCTLKIKKYVCSETCGNVPDTSILLQKTLCLKIYNNQFGGFISVQNLRLQDAHWIS